MDSCLASGRGGSPCAGTGGGLVLPGRPVLWVELLGTAATLPVLYHILPWEAVIPAFTIAPDFLLYGLYLVLLLLLSTVGPLFLLLLFGGWLE